MKKCSLLIDTFNYIQVSPLSIKNLDVPWKSPRGQIFMFQEAKRAVILHKK